MEYGEETDLGAEAFWIGCDFQQSLGTGRKQQIEECGRAGQGERVEFVGHGEYDVEIVGVEQIPLLRLDPSLAGLCLALGTAS
jgi:hypothetical protein